MLWPKLHVMKRMYQIHFDSFRNSFERHSILTLPAIVLEPRVILGSSDHAERVPNSGNKQYPSLLGQSWPGSGQTNIRFQVVIWG